MNLDAHISSAKYVQKVVQQETQVLTNESASADMTTHNDVNLLLNLSSHQTLSKLVSRANASTEWMFKGTSILQLFLDFQQHVNGITASALLHMEPSIHKAFTLSHFLLDRIRLLLKVMSRI
ncbi:hypothetical protein BD560DRAFT_472707 [Blakeslea trispora]|nr:hypothetical protein BD560DRAFT_472689 [Blakeslea trispora]KAI8364599.1 hypothetical protein BD560DRAFT_472707 [Blakeslea trispora]